MADASTIFTAIVTATGGLVLMGADLPAPASNGSDTAISGPKAWGSGSSTPSSIPPSFSALQPLETERGNDGRLYFSAHVNEQPLRFLIDTAASHTVLSLSDAARSNVVTTGRIRVQTAGGIIQAREGVAQNLVLGHKSLRNQRVLIIEDLPVSLLGMDVLSTMDATYIAL